MKTPQDGQPTQSWLQVNKMWLIIGAAVLVVVALIGGYATKQSVISEGNRIQNLLNNNFRQNTAALGDCDIKITELSGLTAEQSRQFKEALIAVSNGSIKGDVKSGGSFWPVIVQQWPDLKGLSDPWNRLYSTTEGCRSDFTNAQKKLSDNLQVFDNWRNGGWTVRTFGGADYPTDALKAQVGNQTYTGQDALDKMSKMLTTQGAQDAYQTGVIKPNTPFGPASPAPSK